MSRSEDWRPTAPIANLKLRAELLKQLRTWFETRGILEVDTPALSGAGATDRHIHSFRVADGRSFRYLHTSPEFPMKRLLAAGSGDIYQVCKVFRAGEAGRLHNPEFTLIEWYRTGFDHFRLMEEVAGLLAELLPSRGRKTEHLSYREAFQRHTGLDPFTANAAACCESWRRMGLPGELDATLDSDGCLDMLAGAVVYPALGHDGLTFIYDYPASQAALARVRPGDPPVAERFEVFLDGIEVANGFHELAEPGEQRTRFEADRAWRKAHGLVDVSLDERLLAALEAGLPECAGVALGFDRLVMIAAGAGSLQDVMAFTSDRA